MTSPGPAGRPVAGQLHGEGMVPVSKHITRALSAAAAAGGDPRAKAIATALRFPCVPGRRWAGLPPGLMGGAVTQPPDHPRVLTSAQVNHRGRGTAMQIPASSRGRLTGAGLAALSLGLAAAAAAPAASAARQAPAAASARPARTRPATAYVANFNSNTVTPINTATGKKLKTIKTVTWPVAVAITPNGKGAYVASGKWGTVSVISTATSTVVKTIKVTVGSSVMAIAITPNGKTAYVTDQSTAAVTPIRTATKTTLKPIKVGRDPWFIAITPDGKTVYVTDPGFVGSGDTVTPIRTATNTAQKPITVGSDPVAIAITP